MVVGDDESLAKMSGGDVDVEPYLDSRNTIGHGNHNSNSSKQNGSKLSELVAVTAMVVPCGIGGGMRKWWSYAEVYVGTGTKLDES